MWDKPFGKHWMATSTSDVDEARAALESVFQPRQLSLDERPGAAGSLELVLNALSVGEVTIGYVRFGGGVRITFETENLQVNVPLRGATECRIGETERVRTSPGLGAVFMPGLPSQLDWHGGCAQFCLVFPRHAVQLELEAMLGRPLGAPIRFAPAMDLTAEIGKAWIAALQLVEQQAWCPQSLLGHPLATGNLEKLLIDGLLLSQPHNYTDALTQARPPDVPSAVRQAIDLMQSCPEQPWTTSSLASRVAVSARCLQEGFQRSTGVPPMRYLRDVRLNQVHADLWAANPDSVTVCQVARRWGFRYLGRFAAAYREKFGQTPSETLRTPGTHAPVSRGRSKRAG